MSAMRFQLSSIKLIISITLCFAFNPATGQLNNPGGVILGRHLEPPLLSTHNNSALTEDALKSHDVPKQYTATDGISDKEARVNKGIFNALSLIINKVKGEGTSSLTEPLLQSDTKIGNGDEMLVKYLQANTERTEAQDSLLHAAIKKFRESKDPSDQTFGDIEYIHLLTNPKSAEVVYDEWFNGKETPFTAIKRLDRSFDDSSPDSSLQNFFKHRLALPWLSYVGYCWKYNKGNFFEENLLRFFKEARLKEKTMAELIYNARDFPFGQVVFDRMQQYSVSRLSTRDLAFRLERTISGSADYSKFWQMLLEQKDHLDDTPLNVWLEYVAYCLFYATEPSAFLPIYPAVQAFFEAEKVNVASQISMFELMIRDLNNKKVATTSSGLDPKLQPFAESTNLGNSARLKSLRLRQLAVFMISYLKSA